MKWIFKTKLELNGMERLKSRIATKGCLQIPGVDYMERFSPVATDTSTRMIIGFMLFYHWVGESWICEAFDVEAAFLEPFLDIQMYIKWPDGMVELVFLRRISTSLHALSYDDPCTGMSMWLYNRNENLRNFLVTDCGFTACCSDPCILFLREDGQLKIVMSIHVDDSLCSGSRENLDELYENVRKRYKFSTLGQIIKYLGVRYKWKFDENGELYVAASMEKNTTEIINYYEKNIGESAKVYETPGWQNSVLNKNEKEMIMLEEYRSFVGKLLNYTVKVGPDCANQKITTLSSTESEYFTLGECGQELKFICMFLQEVGVGEMPGIIYEDNEGAIFLAKNSQVGMHTKHIDVKYHFLGILCRTST